MSEFNQEPENVVSDGTVAPSELADSQLAAEQGEQQPQSAQAETSVPTSGLGIAGLVLGILAVPPAFIPLINFLSLPLAIIGVILAAVGLSGIKKGKAKGKGIATAGLVLSIVAIAIFVIMYGSAAAVSGSDASSGNSASSQQSATTEQQADDASETGASADSDASDEQSEYAVEIVSAKISKDYSGDPAIIVTYKWKNNSDKKTSFAATFNCTCYQNGVELPTAVVFDGTDNDGYLAEVKPGHGTTVQHAYELKNKKDDVEIEVCPLINFNDEVYASKTFSIK